MGKEKEEWGEGEEEGKLHHTPNIVICKEYRGPHTRKIFICSN